jgi:Holliday junction resolvase RusA-like endonuclease
MTSYTFNTPPVPASRPRVTRWGTYYSKTYNNYKAEMAFSLEGRKDLILHKGLLEVEIIFHVTIPKSWSKKKVSEKNGQFCDNNADIDNYIKAIFDALNGILYEDDRQIVRIKNSEKRYSTSPKTEFSIKEL